MKNIVLIFLLIGLFCPVILFADDYTGNLKVYMVEPYSRYQDANLDHYNFGFLDFSLDHILTIPDKDNFDTTFSWNADAVGFGDITQNNIMAIGVMFNDSGVLSDAYPPYGYWYLSYYSDAAVSAIDGQIGQHETAPGFTHTVFVEEGTSSG